MDIPAANLLESGDRALVLSTGYFGARYADLLSRYGAEVTVIESGLGDTVDLVKVESELKKNKYKLMTFTHVDTSTAVRVKPQPIGELGQKYGVLTLLDGVCSVAGEDIQQEEWGLDVVLTASQKAIGVPPGLALLVVSEKAMKVWRERTTPVGNYYADWKNWLPIMEAYEARKPSYFGTPAVNLVCALEVSLQQILAEGMKNRFARHEKNAVACRAALKTLGMNMVPTSEEHAAATLSAPYYPEGITGAEFLTGVKTAGAILAGGLHPQIKAEYFRIGHMGASKSADILATIGAIEAALNELKYSFEPGAGLEAAQNVLLA
jgi:alanine-glyoxylate transaminase/serine-glyoxylate transaminase/serine-pyruvate transaminase